MSSSHRSVWWPMTQLGVGISSPDYDLAPPPKKKLCLIDFRYRPPMGRFKLIVLLGELYALTTHNFNNKTIYHNPIDRYKVVLYDTICKYNSLYYSSCIIWLIIYFLNIILEVWIFKKKKFKNCVAPPGLWPCNPSGDQIVTGGHSVRKRDDGNIMDVGSARMSN